MYRIIDALSQKKLAPFLISGLSASKALIHDFKKSLILFGSSMYVDLDEVRHGCTRCAPDKKCRNIIGNYQCECGDGQMKISQSGIEDICISAWIPYALICVGIMTIGKTNVKLKPY